MRLCRGRALYLHRCQPFCVRLNVADARITTRSIVRDGTTCTDRGGSAKRFQHTQGSHGSARRAAAEGSSPTTIYALSTAPGRAAIAIVRISGGACREIHQKLCPGKRLPKPRYAAVRTLYDQRKSVGRDAVLDANALVLFFPAPHTVTGEDVLELHVHGGPATVKAVLAAIGGCSTPSDPIRYAEPGEFTRRAFMNNRLDLPQVEALGDTLSAVTEEQRRLAVHGTENGLAQRYESWRDMLLQARGELEALIDFSEDQHFDESATELISSVAARVRALAQTIAFHTANAVRGELLRSGISISLIGSPNVGKSSILNQIVGRNAAIVSKEAGTTRDVVEVGIDIGGFFCRLGDTAGIRYDGDCRTPQAALSGAIGEVEQEGIKRAKQKALESDLVIVVLAIEPSIDEQGVQLQLQPEVLETLQLLIQHGKNVVVAVNKTDRYGCAAPAMAEHLVRSVQSLAPNIKMDRVFCISCRDAETHAAAAPSAVDPSQFRHFVNGLVRVFREMTAALAPEDAHSDVEADKSIWEDSLGASERQRALLESCITQLELFLQQAQLASSASASDDYEGGVDIVVAAESLRSAADCLARITGRGESGDVEEVLGVVFEKFCVGK